MGSCATKNNVHLDETIRVSVNNVFTKLCTSSVFVCSDFLYLVLRRPSLMKGHIDNSDTFNYISYFILSRRSETRVSEICIDPNL